ncbi:hypothetical protein MIMGU_mgv1a022553mg [Erythranthe guttata]|uniref:Protein DETOXIFICATION n=1 Tax=Erythranthe guttata TaxID=4155 RepID=A0A022RVQ5_ERYGU|nr:hypothetical protein MIMGU_mgv1a022553mg [Erythranthe guttata]
MEKEVPLLKGEENRRWGPIAGEFNRVNFIALPMIVVTVSQFLLRVSPMFMLGHVSKLSLSGASIATSLCNVTGFSLLQYRRVGTYTYGATLCLFLVCVPVSILWIYTEKILIFMGQDPLISAEAGKFAIQLIPTLFPYAVLQSLVRYLQTQSLILPMLWSSLASLCLQLPLCWAFVFKFDLGSGGAALSIGISYWFNIVVLVLYVKCSSTCKKTRSSLSRDVFATTREFFRFAVPSAVMVCLEWWSFELVILLSGMLPNPQLETSVLSICLTITSLHYHIPYSFGAAASTLISNELGPGKPEAAKVALGAVLVLAVAEFLVASTTIYICRTILGFAFSQEMEVVNGVEQMIPFLCLSIIMDSLQSVLSGVARGSGWQHIGAYVNLGAYYLVGIPVALLLGFVLKLKGEGLWSGLVAGATVQSLSFCLITALTNWEKQAEEARRRIFTEKFPDENQPI